MLKKNHKLKRMDFEKVFKFGKIYHHSNFILKVLPTDSWEEVAFSVVVSKKVAKLAVLRNRNKRKVYSALRGSFGEISKPYIGVIILKKDISTVSTKSICLELIKALK